MSNKHSKPEPRVLCSCLNVAAASAWSGVRGEPCNWVAFARISSNGDKREQTGPEKLCSQSSTLWKFWESERHGYKNRTQEAGEARLSLSREDVRAASERAGRRGQL